MSEVIVILHNIRSAHNVGSIFRTCEGFGVKRIIVSGYTPYPRMQVDTRLPHISEKLTSQIHKTALGAEMIVPFTYEESVDIENLRRNGYVIIGLEQDERSILLADYKIPSKLVLILGEEVEGLTTDIREICDELIEIPMVGEKESFNVSVATGIALYALFSNSR